MAYGIDQIVEAWRTPVDWQNTQTLHRRDLLDSSFIGPCGLALFLIANESSCGE
jgi:hypothetical protein